MNTAVKKLFTKYADILSTQVSIDGIKEAHDMYRVTKKGKGSFDSIEANLQDWIDIYKDYPDNFSIHGCSNSKTLPMLFESFKYFFEKWGIERQWYMPIHSEDWSFEDATIYDSELTKIADYLIEVVGLRRDIKAIYDYAPLNRFIQSAFPGAPCGAGKNYCTITALGNLYPCHQIYFNDIDESMKFGNVLDLENTLDHSRIAIFDEYDRSDLSCMKEDPTCDSYGCYICIGDNYNMNGSILSVAGGCGPRCAMSKTERKIQLRLLEEIKTMGLFNNNNGQKFESDCLCDVRDGQGHNPNRKHDESCKCGKPGDESCGIEDLIGDSFEDVTAYALNMIITNQQEILKSIEIIKAENSLILKNIYNK
jgi:radical SAM protein with 4Fe4S-binding SPASM domain